MRHNSRRIKVLLEKIASVVRVCECTAENPECNLIFDVIREFDGFEKELREKFNEEPIGMSRKELIQEILGK